MKLKVKRLNNNAVLPKYTRENDGAMDIVATSIEYNRYSKQVIYGTSLAFEIPKNHVGLVIPRSSICNYDLQLCNSLGLIDENFRGELTFKFFVNDPIGLFSRMYNVGDRIGQLMIMPRPKIEIEEVETLTETERGTNGWGSSGT